VEAILPGKLEDPKGGADDLLPVWGKVAHRPENFWCLDFEEIPRQPLLFCEAAIDDADDGLDAVQKSVSIRYCSMGNSI
jgi:hypothetical protein